jgi:hypothetical protein
MSTGIDRRDFAKPSGLGGGVFASGLGNPLRLADANAAPEHPFKGLGRGAVTTQA